MHTMVTEGTDDGFPFSQIYKEHVDAAISNFMAFAQTKKNSYGVVPRQDNQDLKLHMHLSPLK